MKKIVSFLLVLVLISGIGSALADAPRIKTTQYEGKGYVEVDFYGSVRYKSAKVKVWNDDGDRCKAVITDKDPDDLTFKVLSVEPGSKYTYEISGVRDRSTKGYGTVSGEFSTPTPKNALISEVSCDLEDNEIDIEFRRSVKYKSLKVSVKDMKGNSLKTKVLEKDSDSIEAYVRGMKSGKKYTVTVSGVRSAQGNGKYQKATYTFTALDD